MKHLLLLILGLYFCGFSFGEEPIKTAQEMKTRTYQFPPDHFYDPAGKTASGIRALWPEIKRITPKGQHEPGTQLDLREYLKLSSGQEAIYDEGTRTLTVHGTSETFDLIEMEFMGNEGISLLPYQIEAEVSLIEFPAGKAAREKGGDSYESLRKAAGDSWRVMDCVKVSTTLGQRVRLVSKTAPAKDGKAVPPPQKPPTPAPNEHSSLLAGEFGTQLEIELIKGRDDGGIDVSVAYHHRARHDASRNALDWDTVIAASVVDGHPKVLVVSSRLPEVDSAEPAKELALVVRVDVVGSGSANPHASLKGAAPAPLPEMNERNLPALNNCGGTASSKRFGAGNW